MTIKTALTRNSFKRLRVGAFESRLQADMRRLIEKNGGTAFVAPSLREIPLKENTEALAFGEKLLRGEIDVLILFTGIGTRTLFQTLALKGPAAAWSKALKDVTIVARGPKPVKALAEFGLKADLVTEEPTTWREVLKVLDKKLDVSGLVVAVQEYGEPNRLFLGELAARGAQVLPVSLYRPALPEDLGPLSDLVSRTAAGKTDVLLFTNATQVDHAMAVARKNGLAQDFRRAAQRMVIASVGPSCSEALRRHGLPVDLEPARPAMNALVAAAALKAAGLLKRKRADGAVIEFESAGVARAGDELHQSLFMKACRREPTARTPIWLMRQAGRYMKEYRELRAKVGFLELCKNSDLCAEVTVDAAHRLGVDAAIIFSDLLMLVEPLGFELSYGKDSGPQIGNPFRAAADLKRLKPVVVEESMGYAIDAIRKTRLALRSGIPLIGFAGAPFTIASYLIEGQGSKNFIATKRLMTSDTATWNTLLEAITTATIDYANWQVAAGAQAIQIFDSWVGCLSPEDFRTHVLPHTKRLIQGVTPGVPAIYFGTQTTAILPLLKDLGANVLGVDWRVELDEAWELLGDVAIQGNLDPALLFSSEKEVRARARRILTQAAGRPGHIFNLGHGILPETPMENVLALIHEVKKGQK